jgi:hypothetical protein
MRIIRLVLALLMLLMLVLPIPWASYGSGHLLIGLWFALGSWALVPAVMVSASLNLGHLIVLSQICFSGGFALLIVPNLLSAVLAHPWLRRVRRALLAVTLGSAIFVGLMWPRPPNFELLLGFWLAVGLVGSAGLIELIEYVGSRSRKSPGG